MTAESTAPYRFGDLLGLTRQSWVGQMTSRLERRGYADYRRSDAAAMRMLGRFHCHSVGLARAWA